MVNLDLQCAETGRQIGNTPGVEERLLNQAIGVLEEQGVYAFFLFLHARSGGPEKKIIGVCQEFLKTYPVGEPLLKSDGDPWQGLQQLGEDLDNLLFARDLLIQALTYARYHVKDSSEVTR